MLVDSQTVTRVVDKIAAHPRYRFCGNIDIGHTLSTAALATPYDAVVYATGAAQGKLAGVPGQYLPGNLTATDFVAWYNGHPDRTDLRIDLSDRRAVVVGNGNVAVDVARMLALPVAHLASTDITDHALDALACSEIREILILGRRGPEHAAFSDPELVELGALPDCDIEFDLVDPMHLEPSTTTATLATLHDFARRPASGARNKITLRFLAAPTEILGDRRVTSVRIGRNSPHGDTARAPGLVEEVPTGVVIHAVGHAGRRYRDYRSTRPSG